MISKEWVCLHRYIPTDKQAFKQRNRDLQADQKVYSFIRPLLMGLWLGLPGAGRLEH